MINQGSAEIQCNDDELSQRREAYARSRAENAALESAQETIKQNSDSVLSRLAAGTVSIQRLQMVTGLDEQECRSLLEGDFGDGWRYNSIADKRQAILDLAVWINELEGAPEDHARYARTPTFQFLQTLFTKAREANLLLAITGGWGIGKTEAAKYYCATHPRTHNRPGAVRVQFDATDNKPVAVLEKIRLALNANRGSHRRGNAMNSIRYSLRPGDQLFLDECQRLGDALDVICSLHDECQISIVMMGNPDLSSSVWGTRDTFGALASRANRFDFPATTPEDVDAWLDWHGLPEGLSSLERSRLAKAAVAIAARPGRYGGLRTLADVIRIKKDFYTNQPLTGGMLTQLADRLKPTAQ
jgi:hypothetical protein